MSCFPCVFHKQSRPRVEVRKLLLFFFTFLEANAREAVVPPSQWTWSHGMLLGQNHRGAHCGQSEESPHTVRGSSIMPSAGFSVFNWEAYAHQDEKNVNTFLYMPVSVPTGEEKTEIISLWACDSGVCSWIQSQAGSCFVLSCPVLGPCWPRFPQQWVTGTVSHLAKAELAERSGCLAGSQSLPSHCGHSLSSETNLWIACLGYLSPVWILGFLYLKYLWWRDAISLPSSFHSNCNLCL